MVWKSVAASGSHPTAMPFFLRQLPGMTALFVLVDVGAVAVPVADSIGEESMINETDGLPLLIEGPLPVPVGNGLKPVPEPPVGPP